MDEHRRSEFSAGDKPECEALVNAIKKYGWENMTVSILREGLTKTELDVAEQELIEEHSTMKNGYNILAGGNADPWQNPELAAKMRADKKTPEYRAKQSVSHSTPRLLQIKRETNAKRTDLEDICKLMRSRKTTETDQKMAETHRAKAEAARAELAKTDPKEAARKKRKAEMDRARHLRVRLAKASPIVEKASPVEE
tara:strand:- start:13935 stop:14525 length:591 start_codon:yes stop_codon:yes gene_type:complete